MSELAEARIKAVDTLWRTLIMIDDYSGAARYLADLFTVEELNEVLRGERKGTLDVMFKECRERFSMHAPVEPPPEVTDSAVKATRPFVSDKLWSLFFVVRAVYMRLGFLAAQSVEKEQYVDWRTDSGINQLLEQVLPRALILRSKELALSSFGTVISPSLEAAFLAEARQVLVGNVSGAPIENLPETRVKGF